MVSQRMRGVQTPVIPVVRAWIDATPGTISLGQGVAYFGPPPAVAQVVSSASAESELSRYGTVRGSEALLRRIHHKLVTENGIDDQGVRVFVTAGANMAFLNAVMAIADTDDEVLLPSPYYFNHEMCITMTGCRPVPVPTDADHQLDLAALEAAITPRTRAIVTVSPNNPTGAVYDRSSLQAVNALCAARGLYHICDETYEYFTYGAVSHFSPGSIADASAHTIGIWSLSKAYGMAGWRIGYMAVPAHLEEAIAKVQDTNLICPPMVSQVAASAALDVGRAYCDSKVQTLGAVRERVLDALSDLGDRCRVPNPDGAFYAMLNLDTDRDDMALVEILIRKHGVAVMPGSTFGVKDRCCLRVAFGAMEQEVVLEGAGRLVRGLKALL